jgi:DNA-binding NarL/FixJ family response regulator
MTTGLGHGQRTRVFIAEDSPLLLDRLIALLASDPAIEVVGHADDAASAIESIRTLTPDAVILDLRLRRGSGIEVLRSVKGDPRPPVVIMLTSSPPSQCRARCLGAGADYVLDKATEFDRPRDIVAEMSRRARRTSPP